MTGVEYILGGLVVVSVLAFVVLPLLRGRRAAPATLTPDGPVEERATIYRELLELELDQKVGKITDADYRELGDALLARAAALISDEDAQVTADDEVEREIAEMRKSLRAPESALTSETRS
jgi:cytochrome c-type biogenesis protein CcmH/NrfG